MSANYQKKYFEKSYYVPNNLIKKILMFLKILKNKLLDLDECFYYQYCSNNQINNWLF